MDTHEWIASIRVQRDCVRHSVSGEPLELVWLHYRYCDHRVSQEFLSYCPLQLLVLGHLKENKCTFKRRRSVRGKAELMNNRESNIRICPSHSVSLAMKHVIQTIAGRQVGEGFTI